MASRDPAFQWETEVLRSSPRHSARRDRTDSSVIDDAGDWLTVREAGQVTGVPSSTIRKWARHDNIPSFLDQTADGQVRRVSLSGIKRWTDQIGRDIDSAGTGQRAESRHDDEIDLTESTSEADDPVVPEGSMLVPLDAWNRMLNQLGNLHEAGQQVAEARERAARAETEARFLKERLADLREELDAATGTKPDDVTVHPGEAPAAERTSPLSLVKSIYDSWRAGRR